MAEAKSFRMLSVGIEASVAHMNHFMVKLTILLIQTIL